jgi:transcriptional regulator with XRE-family HTH domain
MGQKIPLKIKKQVIDDWLNGLSRDKIATKNHISRGSVSNIISAIQSQEIPDIDLLRAVAVELKRNNLTLTPSARSIRLLKMLDNLGLSEENMENLLEYLPIFFFKKGGRDIKTILEQLEFVYKITRYLDIPLFEIPLKIDLWKKEIDNLKVQRTELEILIEKAKSEYQKIRETLYDTCWLIRNPTSVLE